MPTITEVSDEVPMAVPSNGTEDVVQGQVIGQDFKSNDSDNESGDDSSHIGQPQTCLLLGPPSALRALPALTDSPALRGKLFNISL